MKRIYSIVLLLAVMLPVFAASEAEYGVLSKAYTLHADGSQEFRCNMELTLFTHTAMNRTYGETFIVYNPLYQELKIHSSYTKQKDGNIVKTPENAFVEVLPRAAANAPAYNHLREMVVVHTGLELGATIYLDYSIVSKPGYLPELDICDAIEQSSPVKSYTLTITVPESKPLHYALVNNQARPSTSTANGMKTITWKLNNLPAASREPMVSAAAGDTQLLVASTFATNEEAIKKLSSQFAKTGYQPLLSLSETITEGKTSDKEKVEAILAHLTGNVGLSRLPLSDAGYRIRLVDEVISSAYGTETEKLNLLAGLLNAAGIKAEAAAAYYTTGDLNNYGLSGVDALFVLATVDGKQCLLTPTSKEPSPVGGYADFAQYVSITNAGKKLAIETPDKQLSNTYAITLAADKAEIETNGKDKKEESLMNNAGYILLPLPDDRSSIAAGPYKGFNTKRKSALLLPYKAKESFTYTVQVPAGMKLSTPEANTTIDNAAGKATYSVRKNNNSVEVKRTLEMKKQLITPADYAAFRTLMVEWADAGKRQLLFKAD